MILATIDLEAIFNDAGIKHREETRKHLQPIIDDDCFTEYEIRIMAISYDQAYEDAIQSMKAK